MCRRGDGLYTFPDSSFLMEVLALEQGFSDYFLLPGSTGRYILIYLLGDSFSAVQAGLILLGSTDPPTSPS
jgi:hypothetical protein